MRETAPWRGGVDRAELAAHHTEQLRLELHVVVVVLAKLDLARVGGEAPEHKAVAQTAARHDRSITSARL